MFRNLTLGDIHKKRHVVLTIKTTGFEPENDQLTQVACVEMKNGRATGNNFHTYINVENEKKFAECKELYRKELPTNKANQLIANMKSAPTFKQVQQKLLDYLAQDPGTRIVVHYKKHVLDFMRNALSGEAKEKFLNIKMENMISKSAKMGRKGLYQEDIGRRVYKFNQLCEEYGVATNKRTGFDAMQDAKMLARAERYRVIDSTRHKLEVAEKNMSSELTRLKI